MFQIVKRLVPFNITLRSKFQLKLRKDLFNSYKAQFCSSQDKNFQDQKQTQNNSEQSSENKDESNVYEQNIQQLKEISKEIFTKLDKYSTKRKYEIFLTYSNYRLIDHNTYNIIEKDFIKNLNGFTSEQLINILEGLVKIQMGSPKLQMLMEQYFLKNIHNLNIKECVKLTKVLPKAFTFREDASPSTSKRLSESLHLYFMNKLNDFDNLQKMQMIVGLLQLLKSNRNIYMESLELVFERLSHKVSNFNKQEIVLFGHLFFSHFLIQREAQLSKREKALDSVNQIMYGRIELTENSLNQTSSQVLNQQENNQKIINQQDSEKPLLQKSKQLFDQQTNFRTILKSYNACILKNIDEFQAKDYQKILEIFELQEVQVDNQIKQHFDQFVKQNYLDFSPKELYSLSPYIDIRFIQLYLEHYKQDLEYIDLLNFFKSVKMQSLPSYEQALRVVDSRIYQIKDKWDLDEVVYILCAREDQQIAFKNQKLFQKEREIFLKEMMICINKELKIRNKNPFKVYYTIWKLLFRSQLKLDQVYILDLLQNMRQNITLSSFDQFMRTVEILNHVATVYPEFEEPIKQTIASIEDRYTINVDENETKKIDAENTKKIGQ
ncbi:hypothetical protein TTHERM_00158370 (macronuclear) [Tetrahymena thermophila SB210]|uniref:Uncharacterized protein n=1 Tax=Tetrahymena thermophila (strain SB210) TaxID=312017 RepID=Q22W97_TETTS|nr:hypothetical protein TTHERM_00158370 [Tetrahymena thermophila SB210]EAR89520.2 hypothetical protein TTHERM_00158370 [Tetrahymena thermophila SB210]|eukprot:XP_001009765.2 hypothetical protein TTHERM_00158370 [Tetrahymena thermophila SB210]